MGPSRSSSLRIDGDSPAVPSSGWTRGASDRSAVAERQTAPRAPPLPLDKGKGKKNLIKYPGGSDYLKSAVQLAVTVGPRRFVLHMGLPSLNVTDLLLMFGCGPLTF